MDYSKTILIVDDQAPAREVLRGLLLGQGYHLAFATTGAEALAQARALAPDVILLDVMMPEMNGFEVCRHLRADPNLAEIPVIMVTALEDRESRLQGFEAGADDFVSKPFDSLELRARLQNIIQLNRYRRLHAERAKFEWVVEKSEDGYLVVSDQGLILYANPQACRYLALPLEPDRPLSEDFMAQVTAHYRCEPKEAWALWPEQTGEQAPLYLVRPESTTATALWLQVERMEVPSGAKDKYLVHLKNVTADIATQRLMWSFHGQVSHKLRTPLMALSGSLQFLKNEDALLNEQQREQLFSSAYQSAQRLYREIQDIFQYLEIPHLHKPDQQPCYLADLPPLIDEISQTLALEPVKLIFPPETVASAGSVCLPFSRPALTLILRELLENAQKFHPHHSPAVEIKITLEAAALSLQVGDDGLTLSSEQLSRIWTPYYQGEKYFTGQLSGMGLGLAMVAALVWESGGSCRAFNREGKPGIIVELTLPLNQ